MKKTITAAAIILYIGFITIDLFFASYFLFSSILKLISITLCLLIAISCYKNPLSRQDYKIMVLALSLTVISDIFLLLIDRYVAGILIFCLVHLSYIYRYNKKIFRCSFALYCAVLSIIIFTSAMGSALPYIILAGAVYAVLIITATICTFLSELPKQNKILACTGMCLFLLCDISVLIYNAFQSLPYHLVAGNAMWLFYLPSQLCISWSTKKCDTVSE